MNRGKSTLRLGALRRRKPVPLRRDDDRGDAETREPVPGLPVHRRVRNSWIDQVHGQNGSSLSKELFPEFRPPAALLARDSGVPGAGKVRDEMSFVCLIEVYAPGLPRILAGSCCSGSQQTIEEARLTDVRSSYESHRRSPPFRQVFRPVNRGNQRTAGRFLFQQSVTTRYCIQKKRQATPPRNCISKKREARPGGTRGTDGFPAHD